MAAIPAATLMAYATAATAVIGAIGAIQAGNAQAASYQSQQQAANYNATIEAQNARVARQQANAREEAQRRQARQVLGEQRAALAQAGIGLSGSAADVYGQSAANAELDALNIRYEGELQARGLLAQSELTRYEGKVAGMNASSARRGGYLDAASSLLVGGSKAYGYYKGT
jgi:hypothetical protein